MQFNLIKIENFLSTPSEYIAALKPSIELTLADIPDELYNDVAAKVKELLALGVDVRYPEFHMLTEEEGLSIIKNIYNEGPYQLYWYLSEISKYDIPQSHIDFINENLVNFTEEDFLTKYVLINSFQFKGDWKKVLDKVPAKKLTVEVKIAEGTDAQRFVVEVCGYPHHTGIIVDRNYTQEELDALSKEAYDTYKPIFDKYVEGVQLGCFYNSLSPKTYNGLPVMHMADGKFYVPNSIVMFYEDLIHAYKIRTAQQASNPDTGFIHNDNNNPVNLLDF